MLSFQSSVSEAPVYEHMFGNGLFSCVCVSSHLLTCLLARSLSVSLSLSSYCTKIFSFLAALFKEHGLYKPKDGL